MTERKGRAHPLSPSTGSGVRGPGERGGKSTAWADWNKGSLLTITEAGDTQSLGSVQREAPLGILDIGHDWHRVEISLQGQLLQILPGLYL